MKITRAVVPSLFTVLNIFCGFRSVLATSQGDFALAAWFIILAASFDALDGVMARITKSSSDFGVEFDSLADVVSFGLAPAFLVYQLHLNTIGPFGMLLSTTLMIFGALRLARFNAQLVSYDKDYFKGLPIPAAAITVASFVLKYAGDSGSLVGVAATVLTPMLVVLSLLMVSTIKYDTLPKFSRRGIKQHPLRFSVAIAGLTAIVVTKGQMLFPFFAFYIATGPLRHVIMHMQHSLSPDMKAADTKDAEASRIDV
jgi:CDP-diacylglycerol--serine O-phosphatidyltransferase